MKRNTLLKWASGIAFVALATLVGYGIGSTWGTFQGILEGYDIGVKDGYSIGYNDGRNGVGLDAGGPSRVMTDVDYDVRSGIDGRIIEFGVRWPFGLWRIWE